MFALLTLRVMGAGGFGVLGWRLGGIVSEMTSDEEHFLPWGLALTLAGVPVGALIAPYLTFKPWRKSTDYINSIPGPTLAAGTLGLLVGLIMASLISIPLFTLDGWLGWAVPVIVSLSLGVAGLWVGAHRARDMQAVFPALQHNSAVPNTSRNGRILVDTSAIIDGRIADLSITGFLEGSLVVPRFILDELRHIADSSDPLRRNRGRPRSGSAGAFA